MKPARIKLLKCAHCDEQAHSRLKGKGDPLCGRHYTQMHDYGRILAKTGYDQNEIIDCGNYYEMILYTVERREQARTKIDKKNWRKIKDYRWNLSGGGYVQGIVDKKPITLHVFLHGKKDGYDTDHINQDRLDNRKKNLRFLTRSQNMLNNKASGIGWCKKLKKWRARIMINYKDNHLGYFDNKEDAIKARKLALKNIGI